MNLLDKKPYIFGIVTSINEMIYYNGDIDLFLDQSLNMLNKLMPKSTNKTAS